MPVRPRRSPAVGDAVRILHLAGPERAVIHRVGDGGRVVDVVTPDGAIRSFRLRRGSGLYVDDRWTRLAFD